MEDDWPNDHCWTCECNECEATFKEIEDCEEAEEGIDDEKERELDGLHGVDGW